ncbi:type III secretion apparatus protein OrgA/MxiK [Chromobacterium subtsugae]|uniref:type III secretion apparatus protein OrgA/MxiK n=1 Tax=Chromobacterium subtsugae TaxID=251747 RepID=UPI000641218E|nr:type III secretion apparatus protein OrgA/MxiK [Chromobacterium subtsugae]
MADAGLGSQACAILFDPLGYLHRERLSLPDEMRGGGQRAAVNDMLIAAYRLDTAWPAGPHSHATRQWLRHWARLPQAAYLMGCQLLRPSLARQGALLRLPPWARDFAAMPLAAPAAPALPRAPDHADLLAAGYGQLLAWSGQLPRALVQRLPLLFPPAAVLAARPAALPDPLLLTLALQHAQRHPHSPSFLH